MKGIHSFEAARNKRIDIAYCAQTHLQDIVSYANEHDYPRPYGKAFLLIADPKNSTTNDETERLLLNSSPIIHPDNIVKLTFADEEDPSVSDELMSETDADKALALAKRIAGGSSRALARRSNPPTLIIACEGGISRSGTIAAYLESTFNRNISWIFDTHMCMNSHVMRTLIEADDDLWGDDELLKEYAQRMMLEASMVQAHLWVEHHLS